ncbi:MAG TPA: hypothetical protein VFI73_04180 [Candidatus Nitrosopolaris sp.]|nr:hypothetical protein [Candidatus Nitrosopolaris sp.]
MEIINLMQNENPPCGSTKTTIRSDFHKGLNTSFLTSSEYPSSDQAVQLTNRLQLIEDETKVEW